MPESTKQKQNELTHREQQIFDLLLEGIQPKDIAFKLELSYHTIDSHRTRIYRKLGVRSVHELYAKYNSFTQNNSAEPVIENVNSGEFKNSLLSASAGKPFIMTFGDNEPHGYTMNIYPFTNGNARITAGDSYTFFYSFKSNIDFDAIFLFFLDKTNGFTWLSYDTHMKINVKANIEYNGSVTLIVNKSSSSTDPRANLINMNIMPYNIDQPTIIFSRFELTKNE